MFCPHCGTPNAYYVTFRYICSNKACGKEFEVLDGPEAFNWSSGGFLTCRREI